MCSLPSPLFDPMKNAGQCGSNYHTDEYFEKAHGKNVSISRHFQKWHAKQQ
jgi:hypothetical protein